MTYDELLKATAKKKKEVVRQLNKAINDPAMGFLCEAEIKRKPGTVAWYWLAEEFCKTIAEHLDELVASVDKYDADDIVRIYMAYYDNDPDLYQMLPVEAQLFD